MKLTLEIDDETLGHVLDGAAVDYWARFQDDAAGCFIWEREGVVSAPWPLPSDVVARGLSVMARVCPRQFGRLLSDRLDWDADTGDVLVQCCLFGEVRYG